MVDESLVGQSRVWIATAFYAISSATNCKRLIDGRHDFARPKSRCCQSRICRPKACVESASRWRRARLWAWLASRARVVRLCARLSSGPGRVTGELYGSLAKPYLKTDQMLLYLAVWRTYPRSESWQAALPTFQLARTL